MSDSAGTARGGPTAAAVVDDYFSRLTAAAAAAGTPIGPDELAELRAHVDERLSRTPATAADATGCSPSSGTRRTWPTRSPRPRRPPGPARARSGPGRSWGRCSGSPTTCAPRPRSASRPGCGTRRTRGSWCRRLSASAGPSISGHSRSRHGWSGPTTRTPRSRRFPSAPCARPWPHRVAVVVALGVLVAVRWPGLPATVPVHWGFSGQADGYGTRGSAVLGLSRSPWSPCCWRCGSTCGVVARSTASRPRP